MNVRRSGGFTLLELVIVLAILGVLAGLIFVNLPRDHFAVNEAAQISGRAVQFARFDAVKNDASVSINFTSGSSQISVEDASSGSVLRSYELSSQGAVTAGSDLTLTFNSRGMADLTQAFPAQVTLTHAASGYSKTLDISRQGGVTIQ